MKVAVQIQGLKFQYGKKEALCGIDLSVTEGEIFGLVGPNGGGKSTLFKLITSLLPLQKGSVELFGRSVKELSIRKDLGVVFQNSSLDKKLTVWENLLYQGNLYGLSGMDLREKALEAITRLGLQEKMKERAENLSGGQQRRLEIAKCGLHDPKLYLLDEPTTGLDPVVRSEVWEALLTLREQGKTVLLSTHLLEEAEKCNRIALISEGKVVACGTPESLKAELPGRVLSIEARGDAEGFQQALEKRFALPFRKEKNVLIARTPKAQEMVGPILDDFGDRVASVKVGQPTLEDLFLAKTKKVIQPEVVG